MRVQGAAQPHDSPTAPAHKEGATRLMRKATADRQASEGTQKIERVPARANRQKKTKKRMPLLCENIFNGKSMHKLSKT